MWYVYVLESLEKDWYYYGYTSDLKRRYKEHESGLVSSTKNHKPLKLKYYEAYDLEILARNREKTLKKADQQQML